MIEKPPFNEALLSNKLSATPWAALILLSMGNVAYLTNAPTARFWQQHRPNGPRLMIVIWPKEGEPILITGELEREVTRESVWIQDLECYPDYLQSPIDKLAEVLRARGLGDQALGLELGAIGVGDFQQLQRQLPTARFEDCGELMAQVRLVKTAEELRRLKRGADLMDAAYLEGFHATRAGDSEADLNDAILRALMDLGASSVAGITLAGERAMVMHRLSSPEKKLVHGDILRMDFVAVFEGYHANLSRVAVVGEPSKEQREIYQKLLEVERETASLLKPGVPGSAVFEGCRAAFARRGLNHVECLVGHSLGVEPHEDPMIVPTDHAPLAEDAVIALEPLILKQYHLQDTYRVTPAGGVLFSDQFDTEEMYVLP